MSPRLIPPNTLRFTVVLGLLAALPSLSIDINAPTLLAVQEQLLAPAGIIGLTITLFMVGFAFGQFGAGPLSDRYGRRPVLLVGLAGYTVAAIGCALSGSSFQLVSWRLVQGVAAGACAVLAFAMIRDLFEGDAARSKRAYVTVVFGLAPMLAPSLGAIVLEWAGWRPVYVILSLGGLALLMAVALGVAESRVAQTTWLKRPVRSAYGRVLSDRRFIGLAAVNALSFGGMFAYIAGSPMVLMGHGGVTPSAYGAIFACTAASLTAGAWTSGRCASAGVGSRRLLWLSLTMAAASAVALMLLLAINVGSLLMVVPLLLVNLFCRGVVAPNAQHLALEPIAEQAGTAAAAVGVMQILTGALASAAVAALLPWFGPFGMTVVMATLSLASLGLWIWISMTPEPVSTGRPVAVAEPVV